MPVSNQIGDRSFKLVNSIITLLIFGATTCGIAFAEERQSGGPTASVEGAELYFVDLKDGATVATKVTIRFGLRGMGVAPAGEDREKTGHHHLLIDAELPPLDQPIANDSNHLHFDAGQSEAEVTLDPGTHTLQLLLGDKDHVPHNPPVMSPRIQVVVTEGGAAPAAAAPAPAGKRQSVPSPDALKKRIPERLERYLPDRLPDPRDFRR
jgi:hypothetical protein